MAQKIIETLIATTQTFTVDTGEFDVALSESTNGLYAYAIGSDAKKLFANNDNATILEIGVTLPYQFCGGSEPFSFGLTWSDQGDTSSETIGEWWLPQDSLSMDLRDSNGQGLWTRNPRAGGSWITQSKLNARAIGRVSMINAPESLNGQVLEAVVWVKVQHLLPLENES